MVGSRAAAQFESQHSNSEMKERIRDDNRLHGEHESGLDARVGIKGRPSSNGFTGESLCISATWGLSATSAVHVSRYVSYTLKKAPGI